MFKLGILTNKLPHGPFWNYMQILVSGPGLVILGLILVRRFGQNIFNKACGLLLIFLGILWLFLLISDIVRESA